MEAGRVPLRDAAQRRGNPRAAGRLPGAQPLQQRLLRPAGRDGAPPGDARRHGRERRTRPERQVRQGAAAVHRGANDKIN